MFVYPNLIFTLHLFDKKTLFRTFSVFIVASGKCIVYHYHYCVYVSKHDVQYLDRFCSLKHDSTYKRPNR